MQIVLRDNQPQQGPLAIEFPVTTNSHALLLCRLSDQSKYPKLTSPKCFTAAALSSSKQVGKLVNGLYLKAVVRGWVGVGREQTRITKENPYQSFCKSFFWGRVGAGGGGGGLEDGSSR